MDFNRVSPGVTLMDANLKISGLAVSEGSMKFGLSLQIMVNLAIFTVSSN